MSRFMLSYTQRNSPIHKLSGVTKLIVFILWSVLTMAGFDTRVMLIMSAIGIILFIISKTELKEVSFIFKMLIVFMFFNVIGIYLFAPEQGVEIYGTRNIIINGIGRYTLTWEQLFYLFNVLVKYTMIIPMAILLIVTTHPSEFASSLNKIGISYYIAYAFSLSLRYIPDVQRDYQAISMAQQARGIELSKKASVIKRLKGAASILMPLVFSSLDRIDVISHAMELRSFGKEKKRTWYIARSFRKLDVIVLIVSCILFALGIWFTFKDGNRYYNPFA
jgi:energy-coupling factor transport system permease protein